MNDTTPELLFNKPTRIQIPKPGQESVWDYPHPPKLEYIQQHIRVEFGGLVMAETTHGYRFLETGCAPVHYFPPCDVRMAYFFLTSRQSVCEWRGVAHYWALRVDKHEEVDAAWGYPNPKKGYEVIRDYIGFYPRKVSCYVGKQKVKGQAGDFYGGWITSKILGPFKGEPGTEF